MIKDALLRIEAISVDSPRQRASVVVRICGRTMKFPVDSFEMPIELQYHDAARRKLFEVALDACDGEPVEPPIDLSAFVRESFSTWPAPFGDIEHAERRGDFVLTRTEYREPGVFAVYFDFDRIPSEVLMDIREPTSPALFRFVSGVHPWQLGHDERTTLLQGLAGAVRDAAGLESTVVV